MGIRDIIEQQKQRFFLARDSDKLALQKATLAKERAALQERRNLEADVRKEQQAIRDLKSQPSRERMARVKEGFKKIQQGAKRSDTYLSSMGGAGPSSPFKQDTNHFGPDKPRTTVTKPKARTITVRLRE